MFLLSYKFTKMHISIIKRRYVFLVSLSLNKFSCDKYGFSLDKMIKIVNNFKIVYIA